MFARVKTCGTQVIIGKVRNKILSCIGNYDSIRLCLYCLEVLYSTSQK